MAASTGRHVPLCFYRYSRALLRKRQHTLFSRLGNDTSYGATLNGHILTQSPPSRRCFSQVTGEGSGKQTSEGGKGSSLTLSQNSQGNGAEKRRLLKAKKEARRQIALEKQKQKQAKKTEKRSITYDIPTIPGQKKDVTIPLPDAYSPQYVEAAWYDWWQQQGFFSPETTQGGYKSITETGRFVICLPPPNVTGTLHLGHALGNSIQDALCRWRRMQGQSVLWVPGSDHAGIATQVVVEKMLAREHGLTRHQVGREAFIDHAWTWKKEKGGVISDQMRRLGSTLDWSREYFTLDAHHSWAVNEAFIRLHDEGYIYRKERLVNWCCVLKSTISDIEVDSLPVDKKTYLSVPGYDKKIPFGELTSFAYPVVGSDEEVVVSTTRLETMLGDTAVAVHPDDQRFTHLHGQTLLHPLTGRTIPLITDSTVQQDYGSGAVKITPGHDQKDYDMGQRHSIPLLNILDDDGRLINVPEAFNGVPRFDARQAVLKSLKEKNLYRGSKDNAMVLPQCSRSGDIIEPLLKDQWYVDCTLMSELAVEAVKSGELELIPNQYEAHWFEWLKDPRDWCLSRQLWWGHQIPAYRVVGLKSGQPLPPDAPEWVSGHNVAEARGKVAEALEMAESEVIVEQDEDVLDTWFSSAIIPFAAMGWPDKTKMTSDIDHYYPTDLLETASDILFFWVARMVMVGQTLTNQLPFKKVLLHSILRDSHGRKMSKSLGNIVDPMDVIQGITLEDLHSKLTSSNLSEAEVVKAREGQRKDFPLGIEQCGTDALRFTMCSYNYKNQFVNVDVSHMAANRRFCNKIWQAFRFCASHWDKDYTPPAQLKLTDAVSATDRWVLSQLSDMVTRCQQGFETHALYTVTSATYTFWWLRFCDIYLEYSKGVLQGGDTDRVAMVTDILYLCVSTGLRSLSPFMPFLTEELYQRLPGVDLEKTPSVSLASYPRPEDFTWKDAEIDDGMLYVQGIINQILSVRKDFSLGKQKQDVIIVAASDATAKTVSDFEETLMSLSRSSSVSVMTNNPGDVSGCVKQEAQDGSVIYMKLAGLVDPQPELDKNTVRRNKLEEERQRLVERQNKHGVTEETKLVLNEKIKKIVSDLERLERASESLKSLL